MDLEVKSCAQLKEAARADVQRIRDDASQVDAHAGVQLSRGGAADTDVVLVLARAVVSAVAPGEPSPATHFTRFLEGGKKRSPTPSGGQKVSDTVGCAAVSAH